MSDPRPSSDWLRSWLWLSLPLLAGLGLLALVFPDEAAVARHFAVAREGWPLATAGLRLLTDWGLAVFYPVYAVILVRGLRRSDGRAVRFVLLWLVAQLAVSLVLARVLKIGLGRPRPDAGDLDLLGPSLAASRHSFPSGHATEAYVSTAPLALRSGPGLAAFLGLYSGLVALSRVFLGWHHPTDVFFGWVLGSASGLAIHAATGTEGGRAMAARTWEFLTRRWWLAVGFLWAVQTAFTLNARSLWFSDEVRYANAYQHLARAGKWLVLSLNGQPYPDKPPVYFWLLAGLEKIFGLPDPALFFLGAAVSGLLFVLAARHLALATLKDPGAGLGAALVLMSTLFLAAVTHYSRMDLLFAALIVLAQTLLFQAYGDPGPDHPRHARRVLAAFVAMALATLTKGPLGLAFPLAALLGFLAWKGQARRLLTRTTALGFLACLGVLAAWAGAAVAKEGAGFIREILVTQIYARAVNTFHHKEPFYYYLIALPPAFLPWTGLAAAAPWGRMLGVAGRSGFWAGLRAGRREAGGKAWLWISLVSGFVLLSALSGKVLVYILPLLAPAAVLGARAALDLDGPALRRAVRTMAVLLGILGLACALAPWLLPSGMRLPGPPQALAPLALRGAWISALAFGLLGVWLWRFRGRGHSLVLGLALAVSLWTQPAVRLTAPSLDPVMSPRAGAEELLRLAGEGYAPVVHRTYGGIFSYYMGGEVRETSTDPELEGLLAEGRPLAVIMRKKDWPVWAEKNLGLEPVFEQWIADRAYLLAVRRGG